MIFCLDMKGAVRRTKKVRNAREFEATQSVITIFPTYCPARIWAIASSS
jgi:hypothetical protein